MLSNKRNAVLFVVALGSFWGGRSYAQEYNYVPKEGYVPDAKTASGIALAVLAPVYGKEKIEGEAPFSVRLVKDAWIVEGVTPEPPSGYAKIGGVALVKISKKTGAILRMSHGM